MLLNFDDHTRNGAFSMVNEGSVRWFKGIERWDEILTNDLKKQIEKHWSPKVQHSGFEDGNEDNKFYILSMFPYPSGTLHMGHVRVYGISDVLARFQRMRGKNVLHPMGWDAFGLPAENAAIDQGVAADVWTQNNIDSMKSLMEEMNFSFDWNKEFATCDVDYYRWTQFFFLKLYENNLVYRKEAVVNWDPVDHTVLADEQVDATGRSWRSGAVVEKKLLKQWFIRTTRFAQSLYDGLNDPALKNWKDVVEIQKHWIGKPTGTIINFKVVGDVIGDSEIPIWISRPEYIDRGKFVAVKPKSLWTYGWSESERLPYQLQNPFNKELIPVYITDSVKYPEGREIHLGIPDLSEEDKNFADLIGIPHSQSLQNIANKEELLGLREKICEEARENRFGGYYSSSKLQDWLISRQRYWGTPIPIIYCSACGEQPVPESDLPVKLPKIKSITLGKNPLKEEKDWLEVKCPKCGSPGTRETDTMDTFVDSSWYYLRFLDPDNEKAGFGVEKAKKMMPVDIYVGGKEHACLHLYFARFMNYFFHSVNLVPEREPFKKLLCQGMVRGKVYKIEKTGEYVRPEMVELKDNKPVHKKTNESLVVDYEKMSKSKFNGVEPRDLLKIYGVDTTRLMVLGGVSPWSDLIWDEKSFRGIFTWQEKLWNMVRHFLQIRRKNLPEPKIISEEYKKLEYYVFDSRNFYLLRVTNLLENSLNVATAIAKMQGLTSALMKVHDDNLIAFSSKYEKALACQIIMLSPVVPLFASELWAGFVKAPNRLSSEISWDLPLHLQKWPIIDSDYQMRSEHVMEMLKLSKYKTREEVKKEKRSKKKMAAAAGAGSASFTGDGVVTDGDSSNTDQNKQTENHKSLR